MESKKEKAFPRGGKKSAFFKSNKHSGPSLFRKVKTKVKKKSKKATQAEKKNEELKAKVKKVKEPLEVRYVDDLTPSSVQEGMLVLGIVSQVSEKALKVSLPGGLRGVVLLNNVSEFYTGLINNMNRKSEVPSLMAMFKVGDVLPVKVLSVSEIKAALLVSIDPKVINEKLSHNLIEEGLILIGNVKSKEDHGFIIDLGLNQVNAFLHFDKVDPERPLVIGQVVRCCVTGCNTSPGFSSVQLSTLKTDLKSSVISKKSVLPIYCFIPGFQFQISFKKKLAEGYEVSYGKGNVSKGYIHGDHLLNKFSSDVDLGSENIGTLLYVKPFVNFLYFKIMPKKELDWPFQYGEIISGKVVRTKRSGVVFKVIKGSEKAKCFVPVSKLKNAHKILEEKLDIVNLYPVDKKISKIRLGETDLMGRYYVGATDKASLEEKYFSVSDLKCGDIVSCQILSFGKSAARVKIGKTITGIVNFTHMSDVPLKNPSSKFHVGQKIKARVMETIPGTRFLRLTMKPSLMKEKEILCSYSDYSKKSCYLGTIFKVLRNKLIVIFFNHVTGIVPKYLTQYPDADSLSDHYNQGQLVKCWIVARQKDSKEFSLSLVESDGNDGLEIGKKYKGVVANKTETGLLVDVLIDKDKKCKGYLPLETMTIHHSLAAAFHSTYTSGEKLWVRCLCNSTRDGMPLLGLSDFFDEFYEGKSKEDLEKMLTIGSVLPFLYKCKINKTNCLYLHNILPVKENHIIKVTRDDSKSDSSPLTRLNLSRYQLIYGKVLKVAQNKIFVSIRLRDVWDKDFHSSLDLLNSYLKSINSLVERQKAVLESYKEDIHVGCSVKGVVEEVRSNCAVVRTESDDLGLAEGKFKEGEKVFGKVVWIDAPEQMIHIHVEGDAVEENVNKDPVTELEGGNMRGRVVFIGQEVIVVELRGRGKGELAFLPRRRHTNDFVVNESPFSVGEELKIWAVRKSSNYLLGMDRRVVSLQKQLVWKKAEKKLKDSVQSLKRKLEEEKSERLKKQRTEESESEDVEVVSVKVSKNKENINEEGKQQMTNGNSFCEDIEIKEEIESDDGVFNISNNSLPRLEYDDVDIKSEKEDDEKNEEIQSVRTNNNEKIILSSSSESEDEEEGKESKNIDKHNAFKVGFNWEVLNNHNLLSGIVFKKDESSSDEEDDESKSEKKKKRKLTANEKREKAKSEEERLRLIEERLMDGDREPETADDFDRAVLSNPDSSAIWLKYMAFHIQGTEIEKARAVAKRALKSISFRQEQEKLNIWIALLNLENLYGNEESLNKTLNEALQSNEPYKIHLHMLNIYGQGTKFQEMERLGNFIMKKYKDVENMWHDVGFAFFSVGKVESARNVLQKALAILDKSNHVPLISKFAQMENKFGSPERAQTLYESILSSFPKRVDIWCCYVDMLVKSNQFDLARQVLERAISQSLRPRKMKTLFKKFLTFEETHGTPESVEKVREAAVEYVQTVGNLD